MHSNMAAATSVVVLDRGNNTTCTINLHGMYFSVVENYFITKYIENLCMCSYLIPLIRIFH